MVDPGIFRSTVICRDIVDRVTNVKKRGLELIEVLIPVVRCGRRGRRLNVLKQRMTLAHLNATHPHWSQQEEKSNLYFRNPHVDL